MITQYNSLAEFANEIERRETAKADYLADGKLIEFAAGIGGSTLGMTKGNDSGRWKLTEYAEGQLADRLGIPRKYYQKMQAAEPDLLDQNVRTWLPKQDKILIRTLDDSARAILSASYRPIDNWLIMQAFMPVLIEAKNNQEVIIKASALTDTKMYLQVIFPKISREVVKGDIVQAGITLTNSEVGAGAVDVSSFVYRVVCSNGMIGESIMSRRHIGSRLALEDMNIYKDDTIKAEINSYKLRLRDTIAAALNEANFLKKVEKFQVAQYDMITKPESTIENVTRHFNMSDREKDKMTVNFIKEGNPTRWGLANSITAMAKEIDNFDRAYDYESFGHEIIEISQTEWEKITA